MPKRDGDKPRQQWAPDARALSVVGDPWVMVIVRDLATGPLRLQELRHWLPGVSSGAVEARLQKMEAAGLITRRRHRALPPRVDLALTEKGLGLVETIGELARWELRTQWSRPRANEWIDVGACFRLAPLLPAAGPVSDGTLALAITNAPGGAEHYAFVREAGRARVEPHDDPDADARLAGTQAAWVRALSPEGAPAQLASEGDTALAAEFLDLFKAQLG